MLAFLKRKSDALYFLISEIMENSYEEDHMEIWLPFQNVHLASTWFVVQVKALCVNCTEQSSVPKRPDQHPLLKIGLSPFFTTS